jgi:hypothetical protein
LELADGAPRVLRVYKQDDLFAARVGEDGRWLAMSQWALDAVLQRQGEALAAAE